MCSIQIFSKLLYKRRKWTSSVIIQAAPAQSGLVNPGGIQHRPQSSLWKDFARTCWVRRLPQSMWTGWPLCGNVDVKEIVCDVLSKTIITRLLLGGNPC